MTPARKLALGKVHLAKKQLGLDDDTYRDLVERATGHRSAKDCTDDQLGLVIEAMKQAGFKDQVRQPRRAGDRRLAGGEQQGKIRALWLSLYHLGEVGNPEEAALAAWVKGVAGVDGLQFLRPASGNKAIEGLKSWCARIGFEVPDTREDGGLAARRALVLTIWTKLGEIGALKLPLVAGLELWLSKGDRSYGGLRRLEDLGAAELDEATERLGRWLRQVKRQAAARRQTAAEKAAS